MNRIKLKKENLLVTKTHQENTSFTVFQARYRLKRCYIAVNSCEYEEVKGTKKKIRVRDFKRVLVDWSLRELCNRIDTIWNFEEHLKNISNWEDYVCMMG